MVDSITAGVNSARGEEKRCRVHAFKFRGMRKKFELIQPGNVAEGDDKTPQDFLEQYLSEEGA
jgi:hypothetical protein